jgi:hypothetical protein
MDGLSFAPPPEEAENEQRETKVSLRDRRNYEQRETKVSLRNLPFLMMLARRALMLNTA